MISRPSGLRRLGPFESQLGEIERIDECVDHSNRVVLVDPVVQAFRKQRALAAIYSLDEALHPIPHKSRWNRTSRVTSGGTFFHTARVRLGQGSDVRLESVHAPPTDIANYQSAEGAVLWRSIARTEPIYHPPGLRCAFVHEAGLAARPEASSLHIERAPTTRRKPPPPRSG